jgi:hypothetical protein
MNFKSLLVIVCIMFASVSAQTQQEMVTVPKASLTADQQAALAQQGLQDKIATYGKWVGLGDEVGKAVDGSLKAITSNAVELSKTGVGHFTMFIIAWKVIGDKAIAVLVGLLFLIFFTPIFVWSFWRMCIPRRVLTSKDKDGKKEWRIINFNDNHETEVSRWAHFVVLIIFLLAESFIFFGKS